MREKFEKEIESLKRAAMNDKQGLMKELQTKIEELEQTIKQLQQQLEDNNRLHKEELEQQKQKYES